MIQINDNDMPITVAEKIICGTKPNDNLIDRALTKAITGDEEAGKSVDMFDIDEIREIANYLLVYCDSHKDGD